MKFIYKNQTANLRQVISFLLQMSTIARGIVLIVNVLCVWLET